MSNKSSHHILNTAANLLGFCLFVITALHISDKKENAILDQLTGLVSVLLAISCILSFFSIRTQRENLSQRLETIAEYFFISSLFGIIAIIFIIMWALFDHKYL